MIKRTRFALIVLFGLLFLSRWPLIFNGHHYDIDELRYNRALDFWVRAGEGDLEGAVTCLFRAQARPGFVLLSLIPAGLQVLGARIHLLVPSDRHFFDLPAFVNLLVGMGVLALLFQIFRLSGVSEGRALFGTAVYGLLVNTYHYVRHLVPYDEALLLFALVLYLVLRHEERIGSWSRGRIFGLGALTGSAYLVYPGYYAAVGMVTVMLAFILKKDLRRWAAYGCGLVGIVLLFEGLAACVGRSYVGESYLLSLREQHGSFAEGFLFVFHYLRDVEGLGGLAALLLFLGYGIHGVLRDRSRVRRLVAAAAGFFALHAISDLIFRRLAFYGRILHLYFPFLILGAVRMIDLLPRASWRRTVTLVWAVCAVVSFVPRYEQFRRLTYPQDLYQEHLSGLPEDKILWVPYDRHNRPAVYRGEWAVAVNVYAYPDPELTRIPFTIPPGFRRVVSRPHPLTFPAYLFENYTPRERESLMRQQLRFEIYLAPRLSHPGGGRGRIF